MLPAAGLQTNERPAARTVTRLARGTRRGSGRTERRTRRRGIRAHRFDRERRRWIGRGCDARARTGRLRIAGNEENRQLSRSPNPVAMGGQAAWITEGIATQDASTLTGVRQYEVRVRARARPLFARGVRGGAFPSASLRSREGTSGSRRIVRERPSAPSPDSALPSASRTPQQLSALNLTHLEVRSPRVSAIRPCSSVSPRPFPRPLPPSTCPQPFESDKLSRLPPLASAVPARPRRDHHAQRRVHASRDGT